MTDADRISQLAAEVASLKAQLASASAQMRAAGLLAPLTDLPDEIEIEMLINLVTTKYEMLRAKPGEAITRLSSKTACTRSASSAKSRTAS